MGAGSKHNPEVWITGLGLVSSLGDGIGAHRTLLAEEKCRPNVDQSSFAPYPVHPLVDIEFSTQIKRKSDMRQMGIWQQIGVYAAGLALGDAGLHGQQDLLDSTELIVAAGNGERDVSADRAVLAALEGASGRDGDCSGVLNNALQTTLRPTLYLSELSNLLAGNISIIHGVTGSSRTYKGEEMAGVSAVRDAVCRIAAGQGELFLVGGAFNGARTDLMLNYELCSALWHGHHRSVWQREDDGGGFIMGSLGAFLVVEAAPHARARGRKPYAKITAITSGQGKQFTREFSSHSSSDVLLDELRAALPSGPLAVLSGASGVEAATQRELAWLDALDNRGITPAVRAYGTLLGHSVEAQFPTGIALAALAVSEGQLFKPFDDSGRERPFDAPMERILVTGWGHWRGTGLAVVEPAAMH